jgi:hypothetical protein
MNDDIKIYYYSVLYIILSIRNVQRADKNIMEVFLIKFFFFLYESKNRNYINFISLIKILIEIWGFEYL